MDRLIIRNLSKKFLIGYKKQQNALGKVISLISGREPKRTLWALRNISLTAKAGEIVGIVGKNGSGKSTLMRIIAGIYSHDEGEIVTCGKIIPLIYLNAGLQRRLSVIDNIYLVCSIFGLGQKTIRQRCASIVSFAGLDEFTGTKIYQLSMGMMQRLAISMALNSDAKILLLDEVFGVGDEGFRNKVIERILQNVREGVTILFVSHQIDEIRKYCHRAIWLDKGQIVKEGFPEDISSAYLSYERKNG
jgi:ABC-2 type transport system ATP-binding protein